MDRHIAKLQKEHDEIVMHVPGMPWKIEGPRCTNCEEWESWHERYNHTAFRDCYAYEAGSHYTKHERGQWLAWTRQKNLRREIQKRARAWQHSVEKSTAKLYKLVEQLGGYSREVEQVARSWQKRV